MLTKSAKWRKIGEIGHIKEFALPGTPLSGELILDGLILPVYFVEVPARKPRQPMLKVKLATNGDEIGALWPHGSCLSGQLYIGQAHLGLVVHPNKTTPGSPDWRFFIAFALESELSKAEAILSDSDFDLEYTEPF